MEEIRRVISFGSGDFFIFVSFIVFVLGCGALKFSKIPVKIRLFRFFTLLIFSFLLLSPVLLKKREISKKPVLGLILDARYSMHSKEKPGTRFTKIGVFKKWLDSNREKLEKKYDLKIFYFSAFGDEHIIEGAKHIAADDIYDVPEKLIVNYGINADKFVFFTDGNNATTKNFPHVLSQFWKKAVFVGMGDYPEVRWIRIEKIAYPSFAFMHMPVKISVHITSRGHDGERATLGIFDESGGKVSEHALELSENLISSFTVRGRAPGENIFDVCVSINGKCKDRKRIAIDIKREKTRVMYLCGRPDFEYSFLRDYLKSRESIELISFNILRDAADVINARDAEIALIPFPVNEIFLKDISLFDIFILHNFDFRRFNIGQTYIKSLETFVKEGASLLIIGGNAAFSSGGYGKSAILANMLPVVLSAKPDYRDVKVKAKPFPHPVTGFLKKVGYDEKTFEKLPRLEGVNVFVGAKKGTRIFLSFKLDGQEHILAAEKKYGKGRIIVLPGPSTWRWKIKEGILPQISGFYDKFWQAVLDYLTGEMTLERVKLFYRSDKGKHEVCLKVLDKFLNPATDKSGIKINAFAFHDGRKEKINFTFAKPGLFVTEISPWRAGRRSLTASVYESGRLIGRKKLKFKFADISGKYIPGNFAFIANLAERSGAKYVPFSKFQRGYEFQMKEKVAEIIVSKKDLLSSAAFFIIIIMLMAGEWIVARLCGYL